MFTFMRKIISLLTLMVSLFAMGCNNEPTPAPAPEDATIEFSNVTATTNSIEATITPSKADAFYFATITEPATIADLDDAAIIEKYVTGDDYKLRKGTQILGKSNLKPATEYVIVAFYNDAEEVFTKTVSTTAPEQGGEFFVEINVSDITSKSCVVTANVNDDTVNYFCRVVTDMELKYTDGTDLDIMKYCMENPYRSEYFRKGNVNFTYDAAPKMDYTVVAFNLDTFNDVVGGFADAVLFKYEFSTPDTEPVDPDTLFQRSNLQVDYAGFSLDVTPALGEDAFWSYYVFTKESYDQAISRNYNQVVMESYYGLQGLCASYNYAIQDLVEEGKAEFLDFNSFLHEFMGQRGSTTITNYEKLKTNTEYVIVLFYMNPDVIDPTVVHDYNFVPITIRTLSDSNYAWLDVSNAIVEKSDSYGYDISFIVKTDDKAADIKIGAQMWTGYDFEKYWDPNDWTSIQAFFTYRKSISAESLAAAKTEEGAVISFPGLDAGDYVFFFEALTENNNATQYALRVTPDMFQ